MRGARGLLRHGWSWMVTILGALVLLFIVGILRAPPLPDSAPDFGGEALDGGSFVLSELQGRPVLLNFWATWCAPCRFEIPALSRFQARHPDVQVVGVSSEEASTLRRAVDELGVDYPVVRVGPDTLALYGVSTFPTTLFIDDEGVISSVHVGALWDPMLEAAYLGL